MIITSNAYVCSLAYFWVGCFVFLLLICGSLYLYILYNFYVFCQ